MTQEKIISDQRTQNEHLKSEVDALQKSNNQQKQQQKSTEINFQKQIDQHETTIDVLQSEIQTLRQKIKDLESKSDCVECVKLKADNAVLTQTIHELNVQAESKVEVNVDQKLLPYAAVNEDNSLPKETSNEYPIEYLELDVIENALPVDLRKKTKRSGQLGDIMVCSRCEYSTSNISGFNAHVKNNCSGRSSEEISPPDHPCFICGKYFDQRGLRMHLNRFTVEAKLEKANPEHAIHTTAFHKKLHEFLGQKAKAQRVNNIPYDPQTWHLEIPNLAILDN